MQKKQNNNPNLFKYIRLLIGLFVFILGAVFMFVPFIPLGYLLLASGLFLMAYETPCFKKLIDKLKSKDDKNRIEKVEKKG